MKGTSAIGATDLPPFVDPSDAESVRVHVTTLRTLVSGLEDKLHRQHVSLLHAKGDLRKARRIHTLLHARPSPILASARARVDMAFDAADASAPWSRTAILAGEGGVPALQHLCLRLQAELAHRLARLQSLVATSGGASGVTREGASVSADSSVALPERVPSVENSADVRAQEEAAALREAAATLRGRVNAARARRERAEQLLRQRAQFSASRTAAMLPPLHGGYE